MKYREHCAERPPPGRLPLFPTPYPGESFYSVLCRYHVRSANINDSYTIRQLFGYKSSLVSTLLTPFHLEMIKYWMPESTNIRAEDMLRDNTAFTVYALSASPFEIARKRIVNGLSAHYMQSRLANHAGRLRFCPACAAEQKKIYGEPYWQILFQLDEVEYCPIHRIRVRNTPISYESIRNHFYPASFILDSESATSSDTLTPWDKLFSTNREFFIKLARNVAWILQNGVQYEGCNNLYSSYSRIIGTTNFNPNFYLINKEAIQIALKPLLHGAMLYEYVEAKNPSKWNCNIIIVDHWKACSHILLMTALCDHPKLFYTGI